MSKKKSKFLALFVFAVILLIGLRGCYYGSLLRSCVYTEEVLPISEKFKKSKIIFSKSAVVLSYGDREYYSCLSLMGAVRNEIIEQKNAHLYKNEKQYTISPSDQIEMEIIKVVAVTKHGITTLDSGSGPIIYLILKDNRHLQYRVATVGLGINKGDEFLKVVSESQEFSLNPNVDFTQ